LIICAAVTAMHPQPVRAQSKSAATSESVKAGASASQAAARYREGRALERKGDQAAALLAFQEAGEAGYGRAQMRLAEIYDRGNTAVKRDYAKALFWYEKARAQGLQVPKPHPYVTGR
jgi:TPR repeat protein